MQKSFEKPGALYLKRTSSKRSFFLLSMLTMALAFNANTFAQGTWTDIATPAPNPNGGGMLLLSDGSVLCKSFGGGGDGIGNIYNKLTPDKNGSYVNGTWTSIAPMNKTRLYYSSQVLKDGRVYVCGGEYGSGGSYGETYDPLTNVWTMTGTVGSFVSDANSEIFEDGRVMQALVAGTLRGNKIWDPATNLYSLGPSCIGIHNESTWIKLADGSWLMVDRGQGILRDLFLHSTCGLLMLPCRLTSMMPVVLNWHRHFYYPTADHGGLARQEKLLCIPRRATTARQLGSNGGSTNGQGQPDAPGALLVDGKILLLTSPSLLPECISVPHLYYCMIMLRTSYTGSMVPTALQITIPVIMPAWYVYRMARYYTAFKIPVNIGFSHPAGRRSTPAGQRLKA
jgi:hypothetical protein